VPDDRDFSKYLIAEGDSVMEVKVTGSVPYWLARMIAEHGCVLQSHSKYCNALEAGDPVLRKMMYGGPKRIGIEPAVLDPALPMTDIMHHRDSTAVSALG
jgi:hypothetical protein